MGRENTPTTVVGIDLSLTSTGIAVWKQNQWEFGNPKTKGSRRDSWTTRAGRVQKLAAQITPYIPRNALVVVEGPSYNSISVSVWERAALYYRILETVVSRNCRLGVVPPAVLKQWATGSGTSPKQPIINAAQQFTGQEMPNDDVADATILALIGLHRSGTIKPPGKWRPNLLRQIAWEATA